MADIATLASRGKITQTIVVLSANVEATLIAEKLTRRGLRWMVLAGQITVVPQPLLPAARVAATISGGWVYNGPATAGAQGGGDVFEGPSVPPEEFRAISAAGATVAVWEQN